MAKITKMTGFRAYLQHMKAKSSAYQN